MIPFTPDDGVTRSDGPSPERRYSQIDQLCAALSSAEDLARSGTVAPLARIASEIVRSGDDPEVYEGAVESVRRVKCRHTLEFVAAALLYDSEPGKRKLGMALLIETGSKSGGSEALRLLGGENELTATYWEIGSKLSPAVRVRLIENGSLSSRATGQLEAMGARPAQSPLLDVEQPRGASALVDCVAGLLRGDMKAFNESLAEVAAGYRALPEALAGLILSSSEPLTKNISNVHLNMKVQTVLASIYRDRAGSSEGKSQASRENPHSLNRDWRRLKIQNLAADLSLSNEKTRPATPRSSTNLAGVVETVSFKSDLGIPSYFPLLNEISEKGGNALLPRTALNYSTKAAALYFAETEKPLPFLGLPWPSINQIREFRDAALSLISQGFFVDGIENRANWGVVQGTNSPVLLNYSGLRRIREGERERLLDLVESIDDGRLV